MNLLLTRYVTTFLMIRTVPLTLFLSWFPFLSPLVASLWTCPQFVFAGPSGTDRFFTDSGVDHAQHNQDQFPFHHTAFYSNLKSKVDNILAKASVLCTNLVLHRWRPYRFTHTHTLPPLTKLSPPFYFPFLRYPLPPIHLDSVWESSPSSSFISLSFTTPTPFHIVPPSSHFIRYSKQQ